MNTSKDLELKVKIEEDIKCEVVNKFLSEVNADSACSTPPLNEIKEFLLDELDTNVKREIPEVPSFNLQIKLNSPDQKCAAKSDEQLETLKELFNNKITELLDKKRSDNNSFLTDEQYHLTVQLVKESKQKSRKETPDYRRLARYAIILVGGRERLIKPVSDKSDQNIQYYVTTSQLFNILHETHVSIGHGGRNRMTRELKKKYCNITKEAIMIFLSLCKLCNQKKYCPRKRLVSKPIISNYLNSRGQVDLIDMQSKSCRDYCFIMVYQDSVTKFVMLRPLKTKCVEEVAINLLDVFTTIGAPVILQSDKGREFVNHVIKELSSMWQDIKIVHGKPRYGQSPGSDERASRDVEDRICSWLSENNTTDWEVGLKLIQFMKNKAYHSGIKRSPFEALFGRKPRIGLASVTLPTDVIQNIRTEEDLNAFINDNDDMMETEEAENSDNEDTESGDKEISYCIVCSKPTFTFTFCATCKAAVHETCSRNTQNGDKEMICIHCVQKEDISSNRKSVREALEHQAKKMKNASDEKFSTA